MLTTVDADFGAPWDAEGLEPRDGALVRRLMEVMQANRARNDELTDYYAGDVPLSNIGIAVPEESLSAVFGSLRVDCDWPAIAVDRLADRSLFDGFMCAEGSSVGEAVARLGKSCGVPRLYRATLPPALVHGCAFWTVGRLGGRTVVHAHTARSASALWDETNDRILAGLAVVGTGWNEAWTREVPDRVDVHLSDRVIELTRPDPEGDSWVAAYAANPLGRPLMEPLCYRPDAMWRFGHSRISHRVRGIADAVMRNNLRREVAAELNALPQKWAVGLTDEQYDALAVDRYKNAIGALFMIATDDDAETTPQLGQFPSVSMTPLIEEGRELAADFSGVTGIPMSELGVTHDNPSSAEAIDAAEKPLITICERLNADMAHSLENVARMMLAVDAGCALDALPDDAAEVVAHFSDPSMPSQSSATDRAIKIASVAEGYTHTESFWVDVGKDAGERRAIMDDMRRMELRQGRTAILDRDRGEASAGEADDARGGQVPR